MDVRLPSVAGTFYPALEQELHAYLEQFFASRTKSSIKGENVRALISPHAGYIFSGTTAASGYFLLKGTTFNTVILLGPSHHVEFTFAALDSAAAWQTPFGTVELHREKIAKLAASGCCRIESRPFNREHSLEVQVPFLQAALKHFSLIPICCGQNLEHTSIAEAIRSVLDERTLVVVSSDLSHYMPLDAATTTDRATIAAILGMDSAKIKSTIDACGQEGIMVLNELARLQQWKAHEVDYRTSAEASPDTSAVVGYASIAYVRE